jgi:hypothetical protein
MNAGRNGAWGTSAGECISVCAYVERALLPAAVDFDLDFRKLPSPESRKNKIKIKNNFKSSGQECPLHRS